MNTERLALVAGEGDLPIEILRGIRASGSALPKVFLFAEDARRYEELGAEVERVDNPMAIAMTVARLRLSGVRRMMMAGRVPKRYMFSKEDLDRGAKQILADVRDRNDHSLLDGVVRYIERFGIRVVSYEEVVPEMLARGGHIAGPLPNGAQLEDCAYGAGILKKLLPLSFGQSVVVASRAVVAVEAMEGTDEMIRRAGALSGRGVVVKGIRADQDRRYDIPVVGALTLSAMAQAGLDALFVEAGNVLILDGRGFRARAEELGITVQGVAASLF